MPGVLDRDLAVLGEPAVHRRGVLGLTYSERSPATHSVAAVVRRGAVERLLRPAAERREVAAEDLEVGLPPPAVVVAPEVLEQEAAHGGVGDGLGQRGVRVAAALERGQVQLQHRLDVAGELAARLVVDRRDVDDAEPLDELGVPQRQHHRRLAAHRVADQRDRVALVEQLGHPVGDVDVVEVVGPLATGRGAACRPAAPGGPRRSPWRSWSSSCPGRTGRGRRRPAGRSPPGSSVFSTTGALPSGSGRGRAARRRAGRRTCAQVPRKSWRRYSIISTWSP